MGYQDIIMGIRKQFIIHIYQTSMENLKSHMHGLIESKLLAFDWKPLFKSMNVHKNYTHEILG